ncbi:MAG: asparaginase [Spirochaetales bacterium]|nr:asparaginase [Spirochaetales bacterium]
MKQQANIKSKPHIMVLFCGGTIIMKEDKRGVLVPPNEEEALNVLIELEPRLLDMADLEIQMVINIDSSNMQPSHWDKMAEIIHARYADFDGFVITHGTDTMAYTAAALSLCLGNLGKPVILTGSQIPGYRLNSDASRNFINAVQLASMDLSGVYILFDERIISGTRATKSSESRLDAFRTVNRLDAGEVRLKIHLGSQIPKRKKSLPKLKTGFCSDIVTISLTPGIDPTDLIFLLENKKIKGIIIEAFGTGNIPKNFKPFFKKAGELKVPVIVCSQCLHGMTMMKSYAEGKEALDAGTIEGFDQSLEMLSVKLMWALKHESYKNIKKVLNRNFAGELDTAYLG